VDTAATKICSRKTVHGRAVAIGVQEGAMQEVQIRMHPLGVCKISKANMLISPLKTCDTLPHPRAASFEPPRLVKNSFSKMVVYTFCSVL
jgi:hypothetical protein